MVRFNTQNQIQQIRLYWDQGSLLKQVEVIGSRGRTWPIRDASEQTKLIKNAAVFSAPTTEKGLGKGQLSSTAVTSEVAATPPRRIVKDPYAADSLFDLLSPAPDDDAKKPHRTRKDPYAADSLFDLLSPAPDDEGKKTHRARPQRETRDLSDLLVAHDDESTESNKPKIPAIRETASRNFQPSKAFKEGGDTAPNTPTTKGGAQGPSKYSAQKYGHFEIGGDNSKREVTQKPLPFRRSRLHQSQWDFKDFYTPEKPKGYIAPQQVRHFGWSDDETPETPVEKPRVIRPRRDAETHFTLTDDLGEEEEDESVKKPSNNNAAIFQKRASSMYHDPLAPEAANYSRESSKPPLSAVASNALRRGKDFDPQWSMSDEVKEVDTENKRPIAPTRLKVVEMMQPHWESHDVSPEPRKVSLPARRTVRSAMQKSWSLGDEDDF